MMIRSTGVTTLKDIGLCLTRRGILTRTGKTVWYPSTVKTVIGKFLIENVRE